MHSPISEEKVFKDPVHNYIHVQDDIIWRLIDTPEFQRLRRVRQLGTSFLTFHGAEHSRFSHSLGVYEITRRIISQFERRGTPIGLPRKGKLPSARPCRMIWGMDLFSFYRRSFSYESRGLDMPNPAWGYLRQSGTAGARSGFPEKVASVINKTYDKPIVINLVTSPLDADRMDYLLRDAYYTGVNYGTIDIDRILRMRGRIGIGSW